jgi:hypothetical protein
VLKPLKYTMLVLVMLALAVPAELLSLKLRVPLLVMVALPALLES